MPAFKLEGTILSKRQFGESDAMLNVFTISRGLETYVAKGAMRSRRRLVGGLEPFTRSEFSVYISRPGRLGVVQSLKVLTLRFELYRDLDVFTYLTGVSTFLIDVLPRGVPEYEIYDLYESLLQSVVRGGDAESLSLSFYFRAMGSLGWRLDVGACAGCRKLPEAEGEYIVDFSEGKMYCPACRSSEGSTSLSHSALGRPCPAESVILNLGQARSLSSLVLPPRLKPGICIDSAHARIFRQMVDRYLLRHTGVDRATASLTDRMK